MFSIKYTKYELVFVGIMLVYCVSGDSNSDDIVVLNFDRNSSIVGRRLFTVYDNSPYYAFWKIPYALPPIRQLRFKPPKKSFFCDIEKSYDCTHPYHETCESITSEDCLYLSIFIPETKPSSTFPVMVWIHENSNYHDPDFFIEENIIVVKVNFRISVFGFLNTEDDLAQGNMGAKDILIALEWIRNYIHFFNGNPNKVTIASSGKHAATVASFLLSPIAQNLFSKVIIQSNSALSPVNYKNFNFEIASKLFWNLKSYFEKFNKTELYKLLLQTPANKLRKVASDLFDSSEVRDNQRLINYFGPTVESLKEGAFMKKHPLDVYKRKLSNNNVDVLIGYNSLESLYKLNGLAANKDLLRYLNYNFQYLLPFEGWVDLYGSKRYKKIKRKIMDFYFINGTITERSLRRYAKYMSDQIIYPVVRQAKIHSEVSCKNVYLYRFSFNGALNEAWRQSVPNLNWSGSTHGDEICYLFKCRSLSEVYKSVEATNEKHFIKKIARLWANFVKHGDPTPSDNEDAILERIKWPPLEHDGKLIGLNLGRRVKTIELPEVKRVTFWNELRAEFFTDTILHDEL